jgi:hypothetical protein
LSLGDCFQKSRFRCIFRPYSKNLLSFYIEALDRNALRCYCEEFVDQVLELTLDFWGRIEHFFLMNTMNPVQFYPRNPGLNLDPGSTNSSRIAPLLYSQSILGDPRGGRGRGLHTAANSKIVMLRCV